MRREPKKGDEKPTNEHPRSRNLPASAVKSVNPAHNVASITSIAPKPSEPMVITSLPRIMRYQLV